MSPHGTPDWGLVPKSISYGLDDLGEAAVRMGSPHLWDRRGDALYVTDFREGLGSFGHGFGGAGGAVLLTTGHSRLGAYSVDLRAGSNAGQMASMWLALPFQDPSCVGLEFSFSLDANTSYLVDVVEWFDGTVDHYGCMLYDFVAKELRYRTTGGAWGVLATAVQRYVTAVPAHTMKLVVDMELGEYVRFLLDELAFDMRGIPVWEQLSPMLAYWSLVIEHHGLAATNPDCYIDSVIVTQNEPR